MSNQKSRSSASHHGINGSSFYPGDPRGYGNGRFSVRTLSSLPKLIAPPNFEQLQNQLKVLITKHASSVDLERPHEVIAKNGKLKVRMNGIGY